MTGQDFRLVADLDVDGVDEADRGPAAGVVAAAGDGQAKEVGGGDAEAGQHRVAQGVGRRGRGGV